jgi:hypothetical protein
LKYAEQEYAQASVKDLRPHPKNPRQGDVGAIHESIEANGFYGAIVAQKGTGYILAGNHRYKAAVQSGAKQVPVIWLDVDEATATRVLLADNRTNDRASYDNVALAEILAELAAGPGLEGTGYDGDDLDALIADLGGGSGGDGSGGEDTDPNYERKVEAPIYEPKGDAPPPVETLYDESKTRELRERIGDADLPENVRTFLLAAAARHTVFDYEEIAEYYAYAPAEVKELFEDSALVIIDFDAAVEKGFVKLVGELAEAYDKDEGERRGEEEGD